MEILQRNFFDTTTQIDVNSGTITTQFLIDPSPRRQYISDGFNSDSTSTVITISFDETQTIDRIAMMGHNIKAMNWYYNGVTANTFALTGPTTTSQWTGNAQENIYAQFTPVACTSVTFQLKGTMVANIEKAVGYILISKQELDFERVPDAGGYTPTLKNKELKHELSTGGIRSHNVDNKWSFKIKYKYISQTFRDNLKDIYDQHEAKIFVPFPTYTGWDAIMPEVTWTGPFDFYKYSDNAVGAGYTGSIQLEES